MGRLDGKISVVTGAADGIGLGIARRFAREGSVVYLTDLNGDKAQASAQALNKEGCEVIAMAVDVAKGQDITRLLQTIDREHQRIDVLVNNAGINIRSDFRHHDEADWEKMREVNLDSIVRIARDGLELLRRSGQGSLINISSITARRAVRQLAAYAATKGAVSALTRALAVEYAAFNVRVNAIAPGFIETALTDRVLRHPAIKKGLSDRTPMRRFGTADDIAGAALFFASDDSLFVTGAELAVDGGMAAGV